MKTGTGVALAVGVGYLLGRRHKLRTALLLGAAAASGRLPGDPGQLLRQGSKALGGAASGADKPAGAGGQMLEAGKSALMTAAAGQLKALTERVQERTDTLRGGPAEGDEEEASDNRSGRPRDDEYDDEYDDEDEYDEYDDEEDEDDEEEPPRRPARAGA